VPEDLQVLFDSFVATIKRVCGFVKEEQFREVYGRRACILDPEIWACVELIK
jgi:hypothetical protein